MQLPFLSICDHGFTDRKLNTGRGVVNVQTYPRQHILDVCRRWRTALADSFAQVSPRVIKERRIIHAVDASQVFSQGADTWIHETKWRWAVMQADRHLFSLLNGIITSKESLTDWNNEKFDVSLPIRWFGRKLINVRAKNRIYIIFAPNHSNLDRWRTFSIAVATAKPKREENFIWLKHSGLIGIQN